MDEKMIKQQLRLSSSTEASSEEEFFYETIEAPKFVDFTVPNHHRPDDRYWFCSRVGCDRKHEEEIDPEAIYKNFVLRVMAARSPNVRLRKALSRTTSSDSKKCPLTAPPKPSKSRIPRLAVVSSISKKLLYDEKGTTKVPITKPSSTPKARVKHVAAKYLTSPRKKNVGSPKLNNAFRSVRNPKRTSLTVPKNKVVAKALFNSPRKKVLKVKPSVEVATPITKLCEGIKKLEINTQKKGKNTQKGSKECRSVKKVLPLDASRKKPSACKGKSQQDDSSCSRVRKCEVKRNDEKKGENSVHEVGAVDEASDMEIDGKLGIEKENAGSSTTTSSNISQEGAASSTEDKVSELENSGTCVVPNADEQSNVKKGSDAEGNQENQSLIVLEEINYNDDKENALNCDVIRDLNGGNISKDDAPTKRKVIKTTQTFQTVEKTIKENCSAGNGTQGVKYRKLKPTNPKPFRLRTDERGVLKEATLGRKANSHENSTVTSENSQFSGNEPSENREKEAKKYGTFKKDQPAFLRPIKSKYKTCTREVEAKLDRGVSSENRTKSPFKRQADSQVKSGVFVATEETTVTTSKPKESRKQKQVVVEPMKKATIAHKFGAQGRRPATIPREPNFQSLHKPKGCTKTRVVCL